MKVQQPRRANPRPTRITGVGDAWAALDVQLSTFCPRKSNTNFKGNSVIVLGVGGFANKVSHKASFFGKAVGGSTPVVNSKW